MKNYKFIKYKVESVHKVESIGKEEQYL